MLCGLIVSIEVAMAIKAGEVIVVSWRTKKRCERPETEHVTEGGGGPNVWTPVLLREGSA
jgi:hypothetical protein